MDVWALVDLVSELSCVPESFIPSLLHSFIHSFSSGLARWQPVALGAMFILHQVVGEGLAGICATPCEWVQRRCLLCVWRGTRTYQGGSGSP